MFSREKSKKLKKYNDIKYCFVFIRDYINTFSKTLIDFFNN